MGLKIVGFASLLVESDSKEERREYINIMQENTDLLLQLISDILDLSKIEAGTLEFTMDHLNVKSFCEDIMRNYDIKEDNPSPVPFEKEFNFTKHSNTCSFLSGAMPIPVSVTENSIV